MTNPDASNTPDIPVPPGLAKVILEYLRWQADHGDSVTSCDRTDACPHCEAATLAADLSRVVSEAGR